MWLLMKRMVTIHLPPYVYSVVKHKGECVEPSIAPVQFFTLWHFRPRLRGIRWGIALLALTRAAAAAAVAAAAAAVAAAAVAAAAAC